MEHFKKRLRTALPVLFLAILFLLTSSCGDFQDEEFNMSSTDNRACNMLSDSLVNRVAVVPITDYNASWMHDSLTGNVAAILDSLVADTITVSEGDLSYVVDLLTTDDTNYVALVTNLSSLVMYFNRPIGVSLIAADASVLKIQDSNIPWEMAGSCTIEDNEERNWPRVLVRLVFNTPADRYLLRLAKNERTEQAGPGTFADNIRMAIVRN